MCLFLSNMLFCQHVEMFEGILNVLRNTKTATRKSCGSQMGIAVLKNTHKRHIFLRTTGTQEKMFFFFFFK